MKIKETPRFVLHYDDSLESFIEKSLKIADEKVPVIEDLFDCKQEKIGKIKASFFTEINSWTPYLFGKSQYTEPVVLDLVWRLSPEKLIQL